MAPSQRAATAAGSQSAPVVYAGLQLRIVAFILDVLVLISFFMLFVAAILALLLIDSSNSNPSDRAFLISGVILGLYVLVFVPLYHILLWSWRGQTVGMMAVHIKVLSRNGGRVTLRRSALRLFGYAASVLPLFLGLLMALFDRKRRTLHDRLAGTVVVEEP
ncbi:MAG: RDD family protein [Candidatus Uhrbacteria bacterium]|nr:RDD family protein [Candidatus Uhrbacteria bacterium]